MGNGENGDLTHRAQLVVEVKPEQNQDTDFVTTLLRLMGARLAREQTV